MHREAGERRDFLPELVAKVCALGVEVRIEKGLGSGMGLSEADYTSVSPRVSVVDNATAFASDFVLILRFPELDELTKLRRGSTLISMVHFPTRPRRVRRLRADGIEAVSLDSLADDRGNRLVENTEAVGWNGLEASFDALERTLPSFRDPKRGPIRVTVLGAGQVGRHAVHAATKYGRLARAKELDALGLAGVEVTVLGRNLSGSLTYLKERFAQTDILVDATQRSDPTRPIVENHQLAWLPPHAVVCDLAVDPYVLEVSPPTVRGIEGIPRGDLDKYIFAPDDKDWDHTVPPSIPSQHRRTAVTCYSWPGVHPRECMELYGRQLWPLLETLLKRRGMDGVREDGEMTERALWRASMRAWSPRVPDEPVTAQDPHD
jgi:alanine dehydrogenase